MRTLLIITITLCLLNISKAEKYGLVIAVGDYPTETYWPDISSVNDIPLMTSAFSILGFKKENIIVIRNEQATKQGILDAIKGLQARVNEGDIIFIHYSGHGQQIVDDNGDEIDGLDEAIVPYDSPLFFEAGVYEGENLIRDDQIGELTYNLRKKIGPNGQLLLVLDSCHSGSGTRGAGKSRGTEQVMAPEDFKPKTRGSDSKMGLIVDDGNIAPMACFFGASSRELNYETLDEQSNPVGSLSYSFASILAGMNRSYSFAELFERVKLKMKSLAPNQNPQWEGPADVYFLGGEKNEGDILFPIKEIVTKTSIVAGVGTLADVHPGSIVEVYSLDQNKSIATGEVVTAFLTDSDIELDEPMDYKEGELIKVKVIEKMTAPIKCLVTSNIEQTSQWNPVAEAILGKPAVHAVESNADIFIMEKDGKISVEDKYGISLYEKAFVESRVKRYEYQIDKVIKAYTQGKFLRSFDSANSTLNLDLEIVKVDCDDATKEFGPLKDSPINVGSCIKVKVTNLGKKAAYFSVLDIQPDNAINLIIPATTLGYTADEYYLEEGESFETNYTIEIGEPYGDEILKLISSDQPLDLYGIIGSGGSMTRGAGDSHPFESLFSATFQNTSTRGATVKKPPIDQVGTDTEYFKIVK